MVSQAEIVDGLRQTGLSRDSAVIAHTSLRSVGHVDGGAETVCQALLEACDTVVMPSGTWDCCGVPPPPGLQRPHNASTPAPTWAEFDAALTRAKPYSPDLPIDRWLGRVPETLRRSFPHQRGAHPLFSFIASGRDADAVIAEARLDWHLGPLEALRDRGGDVLLIGVDHNVNTTIHLAEQLLGRSRFYRYAKASEGVWMELPNISGESHRFDEIEPALRPHTTEVMIGESRVRRIPIAAVLETATRLILADPGALLCDEDPECRCAAARQQRLAALA